MAFMSCHAMSYLIGVGPSWGRADQDDRGHEEHLADTPKKGKPSSPPLDSLPTLLYYAHPLDLIR